MNNEEKKIKISVIVPVYKVKESLLRKCLQSFLLQNSSDVEYLIVDDGSPDECGKICDEYALKFEKIKVFHRKNEGVSSARNFGISKAIGEYVLFVDGDDYIMDKTIETIEKYLSENESDIVFFKYHRLQEGQTPNEDYINLNNQCSTTDIANLIVSNDSANLGINDICFGSPWGKIFKLDYLRNNKILFPLGIKKTQDRIFMLKSMAFFPNISFLNFYGYCYIENPNSVCRAYNPNIEKILNEASNEFYNTIKTYYSDYDQQRLLDNYNYLKFDFLFNIFKLYIFNKSRENSENVYEEYISLCENYRKYYIKCSGKKMGKKKRFILVFLKLKQYSLLYFVFNKIIDIN